MSQDTPPPHGSHAEDHICGSCRREQTETREINWSVQLNAWCCFRCYQRELGPATPGQLRLLAKLWQAKNVIPASGLSRYGARRLIDELTPREEVTM